MPEPPAVWRSATTPIHQSATFEFASVEAMDDWYEGRVDGYHYTRYGNPTLAAVEARLASLEAGEGALVTSSGMAAITTTILALASAGDRIVSVEGVYGGTFGLFTKLLPRFGVRVDFVPMDDEAALSRALAEPAALLFLETPTNPVLRLAPIAAYARIAKEAGVTTVIDNTFATPVHTRPRTLGVDVVVHSATKALGGHLDISAGVVVADKERLAKIVATHRTVGGVLDPHAAYLLDRGLKTLDLRVTRMAANALAVARAVEDHPRITAIHYPGLKSHPQHALAREQMRNGFGHVLALDLPSKEDAFRFVNALGVVRNAASLGGVDSLVSLPIVTSHRGLAPDQLVAMGISPGTVRISLGIEPPEALIADVRQALDAL